MLPNLLHPVLIEIEQISRATTIVDKDYNEPTQQAIRGPRKTCPGQVKWGMDERLRATLTGAEAESEGYILFRRVDLRARGIAELKQNDRFTAEGAGANRREVDLYITGLRFEGHYPDQGGPALVKAFFRDRQPSKQTPGGK
jgi:hypothetical protein